MDKVKVGILGLRRGLSHLRNFLNTEEAEVIGAADRIPLWRDRAAESGEKMGREVKFVTEFDDLLEMRPDAVAIASNGRMQAEHVIPALEAGKRRPSRPGSKSPSRVRPRPSFRIPPAPWAKAARSPSWGCSGRSFPRLSF